jgi:hypothetical protein
MRRGLLPGAPTSSGRTPFGGLSIADPLRLPARLPTTIASVRPATTAGTQTCPGGLRKGPVERPGASRGRSCGPIERARTPSSVGNSSHSSTAFRPTRSPVLFGEERCRWLDRDRLDRPRRWKTAGCGRRPEASARTSPPAHRLEGSEGSPIVVAPSPNTAPTPRQIAFDPRERTTDDP